MTQQSDEIRREPAGATSPEAGTQPVGEPFVVRDRRRVNRSGSAGAGQASQRDAEPAPAGAADQQPADQQPAERKPAGRKAAGETAAAREPADQEATETPADAAPAEPTSAAAEQPAGTAPEAPAEADAAEATAEAEATVDQAALAALREELAAVRATLAERTEDLQRITAEYHNYRKRVDRDRALVVEQATATVLTALLPVLDDFDRAREHGELPEGVLAVIDHLTTTLAKFGLSAFGEKGDRFDPNWHEAVAHQTSADVTEPTCVEVLRRGYRLGDRVLRPAMVAVADPE